MKLLKRLCLFEGGAAGLFALTTCTSAALREKDDPGNWALGGLASGALFGLRSEYMQHVNNLLQLQYYLEKYQILNSLFTIWFFVVMESIF